MIVFTSSDATANALERLGLGERTLAWTDPLPMGRVSRELDLAVFAADRAEAHAMFGWDEETLVESDFALRNAALIEAAASDDEVLLLFGPAVRDQLNLMHVLAWLSTHGAGMLERTQWARSERDLDTLSDDELGELVGSAGPIFDGAVDQYRAAWKAFVSSDPHSLENYLAYGAESPYSSGAMAAIERMLKEYPSVENGLSLTECQILDAIRLGVSGPQELFEAVEETERYPFLRNWDFWAYLDRLATGNEALVEVEGGDAFLCPPRALAWKPFYGQRLRLTELGERTLDCDSVSAVSAGRWIGAVCLASDGMWYWDYARSSLTREARDAAGV